MKRMLLIVIMGFAPLCVGCDEGSYNPNSDPLSNNNNEDSDLLTPSNQESEGLPDLPTMSDGEKQETEGNETSDSR